MAHDHDLKFKKGDSFQEEGASKLFQNISLLLLSHSFIHLLVHHRSVKKLHSVDVVAGMTA
jgi:hypothetical protein